MTKQTAVEWFFSELERMQYFIGNDLLEAYKQAKEMEKKDMIEFSQQVFRNRYKEVHQSLTKIATDTYNETYGGEK